ncbi:unnamed protein product [Protopolystoma xenopodis]|uniref:Uncharacterized protein n=1 Tax=Protopolystoma xenopodis TaxID=117903 RepID=A0A3S5AXB5_9PLAT|nr:unnamed protein product [Protopolystoma xenopodis]
MARMINSVALTSIQRQFNLRLGKSSDQARQLEAALQAVNEISPSSSSTRVDLLISKCTHRLVGVTYKAKLLF